MVTLFAVAFWTIAAGIVGNLVSGSFGVICAIGQNFEKPADETIDASHMLCYPGLVNTHHHLYQQFSRNQFPSG